MPGTLLLVGEGRGGQSRSGTPVEGVLEDEELARTALSCDLSTNLVCQEMSDGFR